jgi:hypothetical protein
MGRPPPQAEPVGLVQRGQVYESRNYAQAERHLENRAQPDETGSHQELLARNGHYAMLHRMQFADDGGDA